MVPMIGGAMPAISTVVLDVQPAAIGVGVVLVVVGVWLVRGIARELRRAAAARPADRAARVDIGRARSAIAA